MSKLKDQIVKINGRNVIVTTENNCKLTKEDIKQLEKVTQEVIKKIETKNKRFKI
jgi:predicted transcriptional regulator